ncbi:MAG: winged helix-turn-helix domain-containing protein [Nitrososphaeria archaeon]
MRKGIALREDYDARKLRELARKTKDNRVVRRLLALALIYEGKTRQEAAEAIGMDRQTAKLCEVVEKGPEDGTLVRWRREDLARFVKEQYGIDYSAVSIGRILRKCGFSWVSPRPIGVGTNTESQENFKKTLQKK